MAILTNTSGDVTLRSALDSVSMLSLMERLGFTILARRTRTACIICASKTETCFSFTDDGLWHCFRCGEGGAKLELVKRTLKMTGSGAVRWLDNQFDLRLTRNVLTATERRTWAEQRRRDRDDELQARFWQIGALRSLDRELAAEKASLLRSFESESADQDDAEDVGQIIQALTELRIWVTGLRGRSLLSEYRLAAAMGPQEASRWVSNGQTDDEHAELITAAIVNMLGHSQQGSGDDS
jgi:hypothetical protein